MRSKKPFAAKPPDETIFFIDRSLGIDPIRTELIKAGLVVEIHDDHFARDEEDRVWLRTVGERGWVVLTKDQRLRYRPLEIAALRASKARVFVLTAGNLRGIVLIRRTAGVVSSSEPQRLVATARATGKIVESVWSPYRPPRGFGVNLASKSCGVKSFVFSECCL